VQVTEDAIRRHARDDPRTQAQARLMTLPNAEMAQAAINLVTSGVSFSDVAV